MKRQSYAVNFLRGSEEKFLDKFINWALSVGRTIIIVTEIVALSAFLYRFGLDRQIIDLHDKIKQQQIIVALLQANETKFRNLQTRLAQAKKIAPQANQTLNEIQNIIQLATGNVTFNSLTLADTHIKLDTNAHSANRLNLFVKALRKTPYVGSVSVDKIDNKTSTAVINTVLTVTLR